MFYLILLCIDSRAARVLLSNQSVHISILYRFLTSAFLTGMPIRTDCLLIGQYPIIAGISLKTCVLGPLRRHSVFNSLCDRKPEGNRGPLTLLGYFALSTLPDGLKIL